MIDRVDLLGYVASVGYVASDACIRDATAGMLSVPLSNSAAFFIRETAPERCGKPLTLAFWESGYDPVISDGTDLQSQLAAGAQIYAAGRLHRRVLETEGEILCRNEVVCMASDVLVLRGPDGQRLRESLAGRSRSAPIPKVRM